MAPTGRSLRCRIPTPPTMRWLQPAATVGPQGLLLFGPVYCREASHRPLHGTPADAPFHFPDPVLPLSCPFAYAPPIETLSSPSRPMLPETSAPAAETLPSATVSVERVDGSQEPALVTDRDIPEPVIGCLGRGGNGAKGSGGRGDNESTKYLTNAIVAHGSNPRCVW